MAFVGFPRIKSKPPFSDFALFREGFSKQHGNPEILGRKNGKDPSASLWGIRPFSSLVFFVFEATGGWYPDAREKGQPVMKLPCSLCVQQ